MTHPVRTRPDPDEVRARIIEVAELPIWLQAMAKMGLRRKLSSEGLHLTPISF